MQHIRAGLSLMVLLAGLVVLCQIGYERFNRQSELADKWVYVQNKDGTRVFIHKDAMANCFVTVSDQGTNLLYMECPQKKQSYALPINPAAVKMSYRYAGLTMKKVTERF